MDQKYVQTSLKQRIIIFAIAFLLLAATVATYVLIILNDKNGATANVSANDAEIAALQEEWVAKNNEITEYAKTLSEKYFNDFKGYRSRVRSYNAASANANGLKTEDLKQGTGRVLEDGDLDYYAYYIGYCADESIFDSSFNDPDNPTALMTPISAAIGLIEGWNAGVVGMKIGGVRELTIPGELAYGETQEICGGTNSPLKFVVMALEDEKLKGLNNESDELYTQILNLYYGS